MGGRVDEGAVAEHHHVVGVPHRGQAVGADQDGAGGGERTRSTLWGATAWARDSSAYTPLRFPGQYFDPETGLHYNYLRYYDPETGRYTSPDPLGLAPAPNPVGYVDNPKTAQTRWD